MPCALWIVTAKAKASGMPLVFPEQIGVILGVIGTDSRVAGSSVGPEYFRKSTKTMRALRSLSSFDDVSNGDTIRTRHR